jgi:hypothetical protein
MESLEWMGSPVRGLWIGSVKMEVVVAARGWVGSTLIFSSLN